MIKQSSRRGNMPVLLVVDDENAIQKILTQYFKQNFSVVCCNDGFEALNWMYSGNFPDCIVADVNMPVVNGMEFLEEIRLSGLFFSVPLIFLSGPESSDAKTACLQAGAHDFLMKPFSPGELQARINLILERVGKPVNF